jgi:hypothetical protein
MSAYGSPEADFNGGNDSDSVAAHKASILRLWGPVLSTREVRRVKLANSQDSLRRATDLGTYVRSVRFLVKESLEGSDTGQFQLFTEASDCGYAFEVGKEYLVVSERSSKTNRWWTFACSRTAPVDSVAAREDLIALRAWKEGHSLAPRVYGQIFDLRHLPPDDLVPPDLPTAQIRLTGTSFGHEIRSDEEGRFSFDNLPKAKYEIKVEAPGVIGSSQNLDFSRGGCFEAEVIMQEDSAGNASYKILGAPLKLKR